MVAYFCSFLPVPFESVSKYFFLIIAFKKIFKKEKKQYPLCEQLHLMEHKLSFCSAVSEREWPRQREEGPGEQNR